MLYVPSYLLELTLIVPVNGSTKIKSVLYSNIFIVSELEPLYLKIGLPHDAKAEKAVIENTYSPV
jgi:hypothetical protein